MTLPHVLKRIRLNLARSKEFPSGSTRHGYEFVAPLDSKGHIDSQLWQKYRQYCGVRRFWNGADQQIGHLVHKPGRAEHARWVFDYEPGSTEDDEAGLSLRRARISTGGIRLNSRRAGRAAHVSSSIRGARDVGRDKCGQTIDRKHGRY
jgi:hypothetical protein